jgi:ABC-type branched-subunit amino acid transport system ATPase component
MLEVDNIDLHYGAAIALRQVSIQAVAGAVTCILGRNGVGKTSLLRAITGAHPISAGSIKWEGQEISGLPQIVQHGIVAPALERHAQVPDRALQLRQPGAVVHRLRQGPPDGRTGRCRRGP